MVDELLSDGPLHQLLKSKRSWLKNKLDLFRETQCPNTALRVEVFEAVTEPYVYPRLCVGFHIHLLICTLYY